MDSSNSIWVNGNEVPGKRPSKKRPRLVPEGERPPSIVRIVYAGSVKNRASRPSRRKPPSFASIVMSKGCVLCHATVFVFDVSGRSSWSRGRAVPA